MKKHHLRLCLAILCLCLCLPSLLLLVGCGSEPVERNAITSVTLSGNTVTVTAQLTDGFLKNSDDKHIYLLELPSHLSVDADISRLDAVDKTKPANSLTFTVPVNDGTRSRLFSSFVVAIYDSETDWYTALTSPMALQNPAAAAQTVESAHYPSGSIKGLANATPTDALRLGVSHAVVDVSVGDLILPAWEEGAVSYIWNGTTAYLDGDALAALDEAFTLYAQAGVQVYLRFLLTESAIADALTLPSAAGGAAGYAVNMLSAETARRMEGFFDFLAGRYTATETSPAAAFILGYRVNNAPTYANAGEMSLDHYITNYEKLVRVAYTALRSHTADGLVYISLDDHRTANGMKDGWDVPLFLSAFAKEASLRGNYEWHVAAELYANTNRTWEDSTAVEADHFTVHNLQVLSDLINSKQNRFGNTDDRRLLISGLAIPSRRSDQDDSLSDIAAAEQAASYAYTYLAARQNGSVEALIYSAYTDATVPTCGVWTVTDTGAPDTPRPLWNIIRLMDTTESTALSRELTQLIGAPYTKLEATLAGDSAPVTLFTPAATVSEKPDRHKNASPLFTFDGGSQNGFVGSPAMTYMELAQADDSLPPVLYARFDPADPSDRMTLSVTLPASKLIGGRDLILDLCGGDRTDATTPAALTLRICRAATGEAIDGAGTVLYEATAEGITRDTLRSATFPIKELAERLEADDTVTLTVTLDPPAGTTAKDGYALTVSGLYITGSPTVANAPVGAVIAILVLLALAVVGTVTFLYIRHRRITAQATPANAD